MMGTIPRGWVYTLLQLSAGFINLHSDLGDADPSELLTHPVASRLNQFWVPTQPQPLFKSCYNDLEKKSNYCFDGQDSQQETPFMALPGEDTLRQVEWSEPQDNLDNFSTVMVISQLRHRPCASSSHTKLSCLIVSSRLN